MVEGPGALSPGTRLGRYRVVRRLAIGGMSELYLAEQTGDAGYAKTVALKRILPHLAADPRFVRMFLNEARISSGLSHSGIAQVIDFGSEAGEHFLAMEFVHGRSVRDILIQSASTTPIPRAVALTVLAEVGEALHYAHESTGSDGRPLGVVHRDVSPSNVLVSFAGEVKLVDFGIATATAQNRVTRSGGIKGKLAYMAPEQIRGEAVDRRADVFSLSAMAYELLTGRRCFHGAGDFALINRVAAGRYTRPTRHDPSFPPALEALLARGLSANRNDRFETAHEFMLAVEDVARQLDVPLARRSLGSWMLESFGDEPFPTTQVGLVTEQHARTLARSRSGVSRTSSRRNKPALAFAATLILGVGIGLGAPLASSVTRDPAEVPERGVGEHDESQSSQAASPKASPSAASRIPESAEPPEPEASRPVEADDVVRPQPKKRKRRRRGRKSSTTTKRKHGGNAGQKSESEPSSEILLPPSKRTR